MKNAAIDFHCHETLSDRKDYPLIEALRSWEQFVCEGNDTPYSFHPALKDLLGIFAELKESLKLLARHCNAIKDSSENINTQAFNKIIQHVENTCDLPEYQDFYTSVKALREREIFTSVEYYFSEYATAISLPYRDFVLRDEFYSLYRGIGKVYSSFVLTLEKSLPGTGADEAYKKAARTGFKRISTFLREYPEIAKVCFDHINKFEVIINHYQNFCKIKHKSQKYFTCFLDFCNALEEVTGCFLKNSEFVTLPHTNIQQFEEFQIWDQDIGKDCEDFNNKIQTNCLTNSQLCHAYVEAVASKKTFDPADPAAFPSLVDKDTGPLKEFLQENPSVTYFFYEHLDVIDTLSEYYKTFQYKQLPKHVKNFFKDADNFNFLKQLTNESFIEKLEAEKQNAQCKNVYEFATNCMKIVNELKGHKHANGESVWLALHNILHDGNDTNPGRLKTLFSYIQKKRNVASFFNSQRSKIIELSNVYRSQCAMVTSKINKNRSTLFTIPRNDCPEGASENSGQPFTCSSYIINRIVSKSA